MRLINPLFILILSVALAIGSVASALARGQPMAVGQVAICSAGGGVAVVQVDAEGRPVTHASCPDCLAGWGATLPVVPGVPDPLLRQRGSFHAAQAARHMAARIAPPALARGPP